ncbi:MAG: glycosyltransferase family 4 protein [Deltaproteobacteria bacterium]|nr:glycosyltransferase family 4 protein [Deltaproteobacteria bacterium]
MTAGKLLLLRGATGPPAAAADTDVVRFEELRRRILEGEILRLLFRYREARLLTYSLAVMTKPFNSALLLRLLGRGPCTFQDEEGNVRRIGPGTLAALFLRALSDLVGKRGLLRRVAAEVEALLRAGPADAGAPPRLDLSATPAYLRTDLVFGLRSGGSVGHIAGVLNQLDRFAAAPVFLTTDRIPTVREDIETHVIRLDGRFADFGELPGIRFSERFDREAEQCLGSRKTAFVYQRYSLNNYSGATLARRRGVPFVLEYNGSEVWINRNWGKPLRYEALSERIETLNLAAADLVVVVSAPMRDELAARGIDPGKILVNPNGVDTDRYSPEVDGSSVRRKYGLSGRFVVGFIGTFGKWHGANVLADAFGRLLGQFPECRERVRLLMIGDGNTMPEVRERLAAHGVSDACVLTGSVPQEEGPVHLAACDILVSPHVPNPDGTPFFGSPTKLFEYMAMGKGIVASDLDQIGEILEQGRTAWMVSPGDPDSLAAGIKKLIDDKELRDRLGRAARQEASEKHTWKEHTRKIVEKLSERCR